MTDVPAAPKRDWNQIIADSNGQMFRVPEALLPKVKEWAELRAKFQAMINEVAKTEISMSHLLEGFIFEARKHFEDRVGDVWTKDVGVNMDAIKDGEYVFNIVEGQRRA